MSQGPIIQPRLVGQATTSPGRMSWCAQPSAAALIGVMWVHGIAFGSPVVPEGTECWWRCPRRRCRARSDPLPPSERKSDHVKSPSRSSVQTASPRARRGRRGLRAAHALVGELAASAANDVLSKDRPGFADAKAGGDLVDGKAVRNGHHHTTGQDDSQVDCDRLGVIGMQAAMLSPGRSPWAPRAQPPSWLDDGALRGSCLELAALVGPDQSDL